MEKDMMFTLTLTTPHKETSLNFDTRKEAKSKIKELKSDLDLKRVYGFWANEHTGTELTVNF